MASPELQQAWRDYQSNQAAEGQAQRESNARLRDVRARAKVAGTLAKNLTELTGYAESTAGKASIYDTRVSSPIDLGEIEGSDGKHCFAKICVDYGLDRVETPIKGRFRTHTEVSHVPNDTVQNVTVCFLAGPEDASDLEYFAFDGWDITQGDEEAGIAAVEGSLEMLCEVLGYEKTDA